MTVDQKIALAAVIATVISSIVTLIISKILQDWKDKKNQQQQILTILLGNRHTRLEESVIVSLNLIDVVYYDAPKVISSWKEYYESLHIPTQVDGGQEIILLQDEKYKNLLYTMAEHLGYKTYHLGIGRYYSPKGLNQKSNLEWSLLLGFNNLFQSQKLKDWLYPPNIQEKNQ